MKLFIENTSKELGVSSWQVENTLELLSGGATIPFIARYRKEKTGQLTEVELFNIEKLYEKFHALEDRKSAIIRSLEELGCLTAELKKEIAESTSMSQVEDIYLPYKPKRKTRAVIATEKGLEPLARMIMSENIDNLDSTATRFVSSEKGISNLDEALAGARDIIAEWINEKQWVRNILRDQFKDHAVLTSTVVKGKEEEAVKYSSWFDWSEKANRAASHRILAIFRAEKEKLLKVKIEPDRERAIQYLTTKIVKQNTEASYQKELAIKDSVTRLIFPSLENEYRNFLKEKADESSINIFGENLKQLLLAPPMGQKRILAIDPGFRTGCKIVCLDNTGKLVHNDTIYPHPPQRETAMAIKKIKNLVNAHNIEAIAIGNGTAGRETEDFISRIRFDKDLIAVSVNEDGASVYSASQVARDEFPEYDVTVRGAVSIGRRLMDPLAELVKIDPKSIGVGQYQHDVDQKLLKKSLQTTVEICVNKVGVELNTASKELLTFISGLGPKLAASIVEHRNSKGRFLNRNQLLNVPGLGKKAFEQCAGFLRIENGENILDSTAVHPENYSTVRKIAASLKVSMDDLIGDTKKLKSVNADAFVSENAGSITIKDILEELEKPGRDPREKFILFKFNQNIRSIKDVIPGMKLPGIVTNLTAFGAFIDIGIKESGLLHKSQISDEYVENPADHLSLNQQLILKVLDVDLERKRISLSLKK